MNPFVLFAAPFLLIIIGMILNKLDSSFGQPESSREEDPAKRLAAESQAYRKFLDLQRTRFFKRQKRVSQCAWLVLAVFVVSFWWMYFDTVNKTTASKQIAAIQTVPVAEGKEIVLSVTLSDGNNLKYLIKPAKADASELALQERILKDPVPTWELSRLATALSIGGRALPLGIALKISNGEASN